MFNRSTSTRLQITFGAMRSSGLELLNFQFKTNDK